MPSDKQIIFIFTGIIGATLIVLGILSLPIPYTIICILVGSMTIVGIWSYYRDKNKDDAGNYGKQVTLGFVIVSVVIVVIIPTLSLLTAEYEQVIHVNNFKNWNNSGIFVSIKYPNPLVIPISYSTKNYSNPIEVNITHPDNTNTTINYIQLISPEKPIVSYNGNFKPINKSNLPNVTSYKAEVTARHYDEISNKTYDYKVRLNYLNKTDNTINEYDIIFGWTIVPKDLPWLQYFWIVLAGVVASRFISFVSFTNKNEPLNIDRTEAVWIIFTFIIAVLAFASFKENVQLANSVFFNIITAFVFGFGSQKVLEVARQFPTFQSIKSSPPSKVKNLASSIVGNNIKLTWTNNTESDLGYYNIYKSTNPNFLANDITLYDRSKKPSYIDSDPTVGTTYYYKVAAVNIQNEVGEQSDEVSIHR